jgi:hypothetical protein
VKRVVIESPFAGDTERNLRYLRACMHHSITHDEAPYASHGLYTQSGVLDDLEPRERELGIVAGFCWRDVADLTVVYRDLGVSSGMQYGIDDAIRKGRPVEYRELGGEWKRKAHVQVTDCLRGGGPVSKFCTCYHCTLSVCAVCSCYEGSLTTDCPGVRVDMDRQAQIHREGLEYTHERGWHQASGERVAPRFA